MLPHLILLTAVSLLSAAKDNLMDQCMDGKHHKTDPGPEDNLHGYCSPWKQKSCCSANTSHAAHQDQSYLYNFNWEHCGSMSDQCKTHFMQDTCFYECSPNLGPWIVAVDQSWRKQRIVDLPLCKEDCESWYNDCSDDFTCMENWHTGWNWTSGINKCALGKTCRKWTDVFPSAKDFCEKVWSNSYKYTDYPKDSGRCMQLWFPNDDVTPNVKVAQYYANLKGSAHNPRLWPGLLLLSLLVMWTV
ncbi:folate receptor alpha-like [Dendropsophus ebraccatus]|uniref:folate receptor alpha-like n=1 Tax=Dendropsophus ebraccatus TaxID=150705 RepID=UPI003831BAA9